ncbi:cupin domain-containing protein [Halolamina sp.]|uniref:cupin domain-containing protein n=1 Tax=Halolamina sp. TaxID=1940283 RepID=UPI0035661E52
MSEPQQQPVVKRAADIAYESVDAAEGMEQGVLLDESDGAPNFAIRRFVLDPGASVPRHTNAVEHEQYVLEGEYTVGISEASETPLADGEAVDDGAEYTVSAGDTLLIPADVVHWYRNDGDEQGAFICGVPNGDDEIQLAE